MTWLFRNWKGALCAPILLLFSLFASAAGTYPTYQDAQAACYAEKSGYPTYGDPCTYPEPGDYYLFELCQTSVLAAREEGKCAAVGGQLISTHKFSYLTGSCPEGTVSDPNDYNRCLTPTPCSDQTGTVLGATPVYKTPAGQCANSGGSLCQVSCKGLCIVFADGSTYGMTLTGNDCDIGQEQGNVIEPDSGCPEGYVWGQINGVGACVKSGDGKPSSPTSDPIDPKDSDGDGESNDKDPDIDGDGVPNSLDDDMDGDGIPNGSDNDIDGDGVANAADPDIDGDGIPNYMDDDMDGDGVQNGSDTDSNGSGTADSLDVSQLIDEGAPNLADQVSDNNSDLDTSVQTELDNWTNTLDSELLNLDNNGVGDPSSYLDWFGILPSATCTDFSFNIPGKSVPFSITCASTQLLRDLVGFALALYALFTMYELFTRRPD